MLFEGERTFHDIAGLAEEALILTLVAQCLTVQPLQFGLIVERIQVADPTTAEDQNDTFCSRFEVCLVTTSRISIGLAMQQPGQSNAS